MSLFHRLYITFLDALFPVSAVEQKLFSYSTEEAYILLPRAPATPPDMYSIFAYKDDLVAKLIWNIKYKKSVRAVKIGGYALYQALHRLGLPSLPARPTLAGLAGPTILIPMPITPQRRRERGFNQCELLVDEIERLDTNKHFTIKKDLLIRTQHTSRQTLKSREERLEDAKGIFEVQRGSTSLPATRQGCTLLIIDDVITTGSTMKEAIETLKSSGFTDVKGLSLAH